MIQPLHAFISRISLLQTFIPHLSKLIKSSEDRDCEAKKHDNRSNPEDIDVRLHNSLHYYIIFLVLIDFEDKFVLLRNNILQTHF